VRQFKNSCTSASLEHFVSKVQPSQRKQFAGRSRLMQLRARRVRGFKRLSSSVPIKKWRAGEQILLRYWLLRPPRPYLLEQFDLPAAAVKLANSICQTPIQATARTAMLICRPHC
jgi:hypothetical protein